MRFVEELRFTPSEAVPEPIVPGEEEKTSERDAEKNRVEDPPA